MRCASPMSAAANTAWTCRAVRSRRSDPRVRPGPERGRRRALVAALVACLAAPVAGASARDGVEKERAEVPEAAPVAHRGTRYEAGKWGRARGLGQNGGYGAA